jgi:hypothetical protein
MTERDRPSEQYRFQSEDLAPVEHILIAGGSLELGGRFMNTPSFLEDLSKKGAIDPEFLVPMALAGEFTPENFRRVTSVRSARLRLPSPPFLNERSQQMLAQERRFIPVVELSPLEEESDKVIPRWQMGLQDRQTGEVVDDVETLRRIDIRKELKRFFKLNFTDSGHLFFGLKPELSRAT